MAEKIADEHRQDAEDARVERRLPATNMWWPQVRKPTNAMPSERVRDRLVPKMVLVREGADDLADHAHRRQDHDVDGRVRVEPEQVLEQHRVAAARRIEQPEVAGVLDADEHERSGRAPASRAPG